MRYLHKPMSIFLGPCFFPLVDIPKFLGRWRGHDVSWNVLFTGNPRPVVTCQRLLFSKNDQNHVVVYVKHVFSLFSSAGPHCTMHARPARQMDPSEREEPDGCICLRRLVDVLLKKIICHNFICIYVLM